VYEVQLSWVNVLNISSSGVPPLEHSNIARCRPAGQMTGKGITTSLSVGCESVRTRNFRGRHRSRAIDHDRDSPGESLERGFARIAHVYLAGRSTSVGASYWRQPPRLPGRPGCPVVPVAPIARSPRPIQPPVGRPIHHTKRGHAQRAPAIAAGARSARHGGEARAGAGPACPAASDRFGVRRQANPGSWTWRAFQSGGHDRRCEALHPADPPIAR
jgi:hypothetical protein